MNGRLQALSIPLPGIYQLVLAALSLSLCAGMLAGMGLSEIKIPGVFEPSTTSWTYRILSVAVFVWAFVEALGRLLGHAVEEVSFNMDRVAFSGRSTTVLHDKRIIKCSVRQFKSWVVVHAVARKRPRMRWLRSVCSPRRHYFFVLSLAQLEDADKNHVLVGLRRFSQSLHHRLSTPA